MADEAGIEFMLPVGRWLGYGSDTDYQGETLETVTWAAGLFARTQRLTVFGTVHAPLIHPLIRRRSNSSPPIISGRGSLRFEHRGAAGTRTNSRCSAPRCGEHAARYEYAQEWFDAVRLGVVGCRRLQPGG